MNQLIPFPLQVQHCVRDFADSEVDALAALFDLTAVRLVRFATTVTKNQHDAEDAVQAVLVRVATESRRLADARCPWSYLLRMVRNEALLLGRRQRRCHLWPDLTDLTTRHRVDEVDREETHRAVWSSLRSLPAEQAEVVALKIWEDLTFAQIGDVLGISPHTAASRYRYSIAKLAVKLQSLQREQARD